jgi:hypothetical protein
MSVSGVIRFEKLNALGVQILREFERRNYSGLRFTFGPPPDTVLVRWDATTNVSVIYRMAGLVSCRQDDNGPPAFSPPAEL